MFKWLEQKPKIEDSKRIECEFITNVRNLLHYGSLIVDNSTDNYGYAYIKIQDSKGNHIHYEFNAENENMFPNKIMLNNQPVMHKYYEEICDMVKPAIARLQLAKVNEINKTFKK